MKPRRHDRTNAYSYLRGDNIRNYSPRGTTFWARVWDGDNRASVPTKKTASIIQR